VRCIYYNVFVSVVDSDFVFTCLDFIILAVLNYHIIRIFVPYVGLQTKHSFVRRLLLFNLRTSSCMPMK
jgi:hypothetical protein